MEDKEYFVHESSYVDNPCSIGKGTKIWHFCHIMAGARIGEGCSIGQNVSIASSAVIGNGVRIQNNVSIYVGVVCEDDVFLGPSCVFTNVVNPRSFISRKHEYRETRIGKGASIGANATIVCGHRVGKYALIGAGTVVTKDVADYTCVAGNPARLMYYICRCGYKLEENNGKWRCPECRASFVMNSNGNLEEEKHENEGNALEEDRA